MQKKERAIAPSLEEELDPEIARARAMVERLVEVLEQIQNDDTIPEDDPDTDLLLEDLKRGSPPNAAFHEASRLGFRYAGFGWWNDPNGYLVAFTTSRGNLAMLERSSASESNALKETQLSLLTARDSDGSTEPDRSER